MTVEDMNKMSLEKIYEDVKYHDYCRDALHEITQLYNRPIIVFKAFKEN